MAPSINTVLIPKDMLRFTRPILYRPTVSVTAEYVRVTTVQVYRVNGWMLLNRHERSAGSLTHLRLLQTSNFHPMRREISVSRDENEKSNMFDIYNNGTGDLYLFRQKSPVCAVWRFFLEQGTDVYHIISI